MKTQLLKASLLSLLIFVSGCDQPPAIQLPPRRMAAGGLC